MKHNRQKNLNTIMTYCYMEGDENYVRPANTMVIRNNG